MNRIYAQNLVFKLDQLTKKAHIWTGTRARLLQLGEGGLEIELEILDGVG